MQEVVTLRAFLSEAYEASGRQPEAEALLRQNRAVADHMRNCPPWYEAQIDTALARVLAAENRPDEARKLVEPAVHVLNAALGPDNQRTLAAGRLLSRLIAQR
jgi:uncharacterized membrane protein